MIEKDTDTENNEKLMNERRSTAEWKVEIAEDEKGEKDEWEPFYALLILRIAVLCGPPFHWCRGKDNKDKKGEKEVKRDTDR